MRTGTRQVLAAYTRAKVLMCASMNVNIQAKRFRLAALWISVVMIGCSPVAAPAEMSEQIVLIKQLGEIVGRDQTYMKGAGRRDLVSYLSRTDNDCVAEMETEKVAGIGPNLLGYEIDL
jgi:hypothetical protein